MDARRALLATCTAATLACACGDPAARVQLVPALATPCARPAHATAIRITAYAPSGETSRAADLEGTVDLADLPADTEQLGIEVLVGGGTVGVAGKSAPLDYAALADGTAIPIATVPPGGFCAVGPMTEPREHPVVARAGQGALVVGGTGPAGALSTAEYYDPATATFAAVPVPDVFHDSPLGLSGVALATLPDGRVALTGGPANTFTLFDPDAEGGPAFGAPVSMEARRFHAALAVAADQVLIAGGCSSLDAPGCETPRLTTRIYDLAKLGSPAVGPQLAPGQPRDGAQLFDLGEQLDGAHRYALAGGDSGGLANRLALGDGVLVDVPGNHAQAVALDGGAVLSAFAPDGQTASSAASVLAPDGAAAVAISDAPAPALGGVRLVALEDGRVAGIGGDVDGKVLAYDPGTNAWSAALPACAPMADGVCESPGPPSGSVALAAPALVRLADGSVLVVGGSVAASAWLYRPPSLVGPTSGSVTAVPMNDASVGALTAPDPSTVSRVDAWVLTSLGQPLTARALVGGARMDTGNVRATVHVRAGGVALIAQQLGPGRAIVAELAPGETARLVRFADGAVEPLCTGAMVPAFAADTAATLRLAITGHDARVTLDDTTELLACDAALTDRGAWGVAALGTGAQVAVDSVTAAR